MRKSITVILLAFCVVLPSFALTRKIDLKNGKRPIKRSIEIIPINAFIDDETKELSLEFTTDLGMLYVTVSDQNGNMVYTDVVDATSGLPVNISLDKDLEGEFVLSITDDNESEVSGEFTIN